MDSGSIRKKSTGSIVHIIKSTDTVSECSLIKMAKSQDIGKKLSSSPSD